jgi:PXA domain/Sorting nexin C terminal
MEDPTSLDSPSPIAKEGADPSPSTPTSRPPSRSISTPASAASTASDRLRAFQNTALRFLSTASNETLGACAVGLAASTYLLLGRLGLVLIGTVGGIVLHANWEAHGGYGASDGQDAVKDGARRKKELGVEVVKRVLDWRDTRQEVVSRDVATDAVSTDRRDTAEASQTLDYSDFPAETREALENLTDAIIRDYVKWWYSPILPLEQSFPAACRHTLTRFIISFSQHLKRKRAADPVLDFFANSTSILIVFLNELGTALKASQRQDPHDAIRTYLQFQPDSSLANVLSSDQQERKLGIVADDILQNFLEPQSYNCPPVKAFLREVLSGLILQPVIVACAKPEWINGWIVYLLEDGEPELLNVIDAGVENMGGVMGNQNSEPKKESTHQRRVSRAEEAMQQAMQEAERMNAMIAEDEARRRRETTIGEDDTLSTSTIEPGVATPTSSDSGKNRRSTRSSFLLDSEGNAIPSVTPSPSKESSFTSFDQSSDTYQGASYPTELVPTPPLTLHNAFITLIDMGEGNDRIPLRKEPTEDEYLVQIEPALSRYPGWMTTRRYPDFARLHNSLSTIARISGYPEFNVAHPVVPTWKALTRPALKSALELYLRDALKHEGLAESESMKRFLEKETGIAKAPQAKNILMVGGEALENVGKTFVDVLGHGGKGIAGGGKAVLGGVQGVFGAVGAVAAGVGVKKATPSRPQHMQSRSGTASSLAPSRMSQEVRRNTSDLKESVRSPPLPARPVRMSSDHSFVSDGPPREQSPAQHSQEILNLPPPPYVISDAYEPVPSMRTETASTEISVASSILETSTELSATPSRPATPVSVRNGPTTGITPEVMEVIEQQPKQRKKQTPITEEETRVMVDLMFAIITELYSLSSAWTIRLSLLTAAKSFLLRPANPQLDSIRLLLQESVLDANFSDKGLAAHINKLRENSLPTEEELAAWPKPLTTEEKEKLRLKARKLLIERGMPQALTSVMGAAASGEALGKVFDCLQIEEVAKGLIFALLLQGIRAATQ